MNAGRLALGGLLVLGVMTGVLAPVYAQNGGLLTGPRFDRAYNPPGSGSSARQQPSAVPVIVNPQFNEDGAQIHIVQAGQTLMQISRAYNVPLATLRELNGMAPNESLIRVGQRLIIRAAPATSTPVPTMTPIPSLTPLATALSPAATATVAGSSAAPPDNSAPATTDGPPTTGADTDSEDDPTRQIVQILAIVVMGGAVVGIGGVLALGVYLFTRRSE